MIPMDMRPGSVQKMMLLPRMLLSLHVLLLNVMELKVFLRGQLEGNPVLEEQPPEDLPDNVEKSLNDEISNIIDEKTDFEELNFGAEDSSYPLDNAKKNYLESLITEKESLYEHLYWQLNVLAKDEGQKQIGEFIIGNLDSKGYLRVSIQEIQDAFSVSTKKVKNALSLVRSLDPPGIGARNLKECLLIQLICIGKGNTNLYKIVHSHLNDLEKGNYVKIAKALSIKIEEVESAKKQLSYLTPWPGSTFSRDADVRRIIPDVFFTKNGSYAIEINEKELPQITISRTYITMYRNKHIDGTIKKYLQDKFMGARWLIEALKKRSNTLRRICEYLIEAQKDFLEQGDSAANPMKLSQVAGKLSISEATVSRAIAHKYVQTDERIFPLKRFFISAVPQNFGAVASAKIKQRIRDIIESEKAKHPFRDIDIVGLLKKEGLSISRRTVAKYRDSLKILPCRLRKK
jgi:RNA polymerase sigma-54 factor